MNLGEDMSKTEKQIAHFGHLESSLRDVTHIILKLRT